MPIHFSLLPGNMQTKEHNGDRAEDYLKFILDPSWRLGSPATRRLV